MKDGDSAVLLLSREVFAYLYACLQALEVKISELDLHIDPLAQLLQQCDDECIQTCDRMALN